MATAVRRRNIRYSKYDTVPYEAYDGSAARQLEREEVLQPRPVVRPRERAVVRPRVRVREAGAVSPFAVVGFLAVGVFAVLLLFSYARLMTISQQVVALNSEMAIQESLTTSGTMVEPQNGQTVYVDLSEPNTVKVFQQEEGTSGLEGMFQSVKSIAEEIVTYFR